jgi:hypothetical protein
MSSTLPEQRLTARGITLNISVPSHDSILKEHQYNQIMKDKENIQELTFDEASALINANNALNVTSRAYAHANETLRAELEVSNALVAELTTLNSAIQRDLDYAELALLV